MEKVLWLDKEGLVVGSISDPDDKIAAHLGTTEYYRE